MENKKGRSAFYNDSLLEYLALDARMLYMVLKFELSSPGLSRS
jgi:hypothetical protein